MKEIGISPDRVRWGGSRGICSGNQDLRPEDGSKWNGSVISVEGGAVRMSRGHPPRGRSYLWLGTEYRGHWEDFVIKGTMDHL